MRHRTQEVDCNDYEYNNPLKCFRSDDKLCDAIRSFRWSRNRKFRLERRTSPLLCAANNSICHPKTLSLNGTSQSRAHPSDRVDSCERRVTCERTIAFGERGRAHTEATTVAERLSSAAAALTARDRTGRRRATDRRHLCAAVAVENGAQVYLRGAIKRQLRAD